MNCLSENIWKKKKTMANHVRKLTTNRKMHHLSRNIKLTNKTYLVLKKRTSRYYNRFAGTISEHTREAKEKKNSLLVKKVIDLLKLAQSAGCIECTEGISAEG